MSDTVTTPGNAEAPAVKTFTQEQLDQIVKERLARDREARGTDAEKKAEQLAQAAETAKAELGKATERLKALEGTSATVEEINKKLEDSWKTIEAGIPDDKRKLISPKLSVADKIEYFSQNHGVFFPDASVPKIETPAPKPVNDGGGDPKFNGHATELEYAQRDPRGYLKAKAEGKL